MKEIKRIGNVMGRRRQKGRERERERGVCYTKEILNSIEANLKSEK